MNNYLNQISDAVREIMGPSTPVELTAQMRFDTDLGFDSGNFIELFLVLEETIPDFTLGSARLLPEDFQTICNLSEFISRRMAQVDQVS